MTPLRDGRAPRPASRHGIVGVLAVAFLAVLALAEPAASADGTLATPAPAVPEAVAKRTVEAMRPDLKAKDPRVRARAVEGLGAVDHPLVARELLGRLRKEADPLALEAVVAALGRQRTSAADVGKKLLEHLAAAAEAERKREAAGSPGFPVDPRTGEPALDTKEGREAVEAMTARSRVALAAIRALEALAVPAGANALAWTPLLQDPNDDLVVATLCGLAAGTCMEALPAILELYRMYPLPNTWETGAVTDLSGTNASAKAKWMVRFGHPDKHKARPKVVQAIGKALTALTGRSFDSPEALQEWMGRPSGKPSRAKAAR